MVIIEDVTFRDHRASHKRSQVQEFEQSDVSLEFARAKKVVEVNSQEKFSFIDELVVDPGRRNQRVGEAFLRWQSVRIPEAFVEGKELRNDIMGAVQS